ncbi:uncharacterized protein LOC134713899 [Mytilus trossulus]|uniref:uncharacterized protein LOC134713899 n=1 Tax=Mytilus trossulus TaxID=6551 RepID=UPI003004542C
MWTSLMVLPLVFTQIYGQGFQLFFGTTASPSNCADKMDNCLAFGKDACGGKYEAFARENCARYCGYCQGEPTPAPACENKKSDCEKYPKSTCSDQRYKTWANENCFYYCRLCTPEQLRIKDSQLTTVPPARCLDKKNDCKMYGKTSCTGNYASWAKENCMLYCGFCHGNPTPAPPCRDLASNCQQYEKSTCTDSKYRGWAETNCNKHCGFCSDGSSSGNQPQPNLNPVPTLFAPQVPGSGTLAPPLPGR